MTCQNRRLCLVWRRCGLAGITRRHTSGVSMRSRRSPHLALAHQRHHEQVAADPATICATRLDLLALAGATQESKTSGME